MLQTLYFSHGFSPVFKDLTKVDVPPNIDVILVAPKGSGRTVRTLFREGRGINSSVAVFQDVTGRAEEKAVALGVAVGSGYLYKTTFEREVYSDLYGERGCLMGGIHGMFLAQYEVLRERGHSPSEAFNETVEEATQSLYPLIGAHGMDWMYAACSTTARRGAIDWSHKFKDTLKPVFNELYDRVKDGSETQRSLDFNGAPDYRERFGKEMQDIRNLEIWRAGKAVRYEVSTSRLDDHILTDAGRCGPRTTELRPPKVPRHGSCTLARRFGCVQTFVLGRGIVDVQRPAVLFSRPNLNLVFWSASNCSGCEFLMSRKCHL